ncbi:MAG: hypothetical protein AUK47_03525 [Deltaproteobacteria bacterium CG2_30_63_29]|nr:MAG: hypothetical protein AUK47_03525 [Deltaproteobacteria bacterium CG2_30_63_29]PJB39560.1 MAG: hypothetical protein CO108_17020 [Deltaproteobacteria bacterium CG_4_9_14_3_um_filter_63_12]
MSDPTEQDDVRILTNLLLDGSVYSPMMEGDVIPIEGPEALPYLPVFQTPESCELQFEGTTAGHLSGQVCLERAIDEGWGVVLELSTAFSHGTLRDLAAQISTNLDTVVYPRFDISEAEAVSTSAPPAQRAPASMLRAIQNVLESEAGLGRAWLTLVTEVTDEEPRSNLFVVADPSDKEVFDGFSLLHRLAWAASVTEPIQLMLSHPGSPFSEESMRACPRLYPAMPKV